MAFKVEDLADSNPGDANYPGGSGRDETVPGVTQDGTPLVAAVYNDIQAFLQSLLSKENITANGITDTVLISQYRDGLNRVLARQGDVITISDTETMVLGYVHLPDNSGGPITVNLPNTGLYAGAAVLFSPFPPASYFDNPVTFDGNGSTIGDTETTVELTTDDLLGGFRRDEANSKWIPFKTTVIGTEI